MWLRWWPPAVSFSIILYLNIAEIFAGDKSNTAYKSNTTTSYHAILVFLKEAKIIM